MSARDGLADAPSAHDQGPRPLAVWLTFLITWLVALPIVYSLPYFSTRLVLDVNASTSGIARVSYATPDGRFLSANSVLAPVVKGRQTLSFALPKFRPAPLALRWEPLMPSAHGQVTLREATAVTAWNRFLIPLAGIPADAPTLDEPASREPGGPTFQSGVSATLPYPGTSVWPAKLLAVFVTAFLIACCTLPWRRASHWVDRLALAGRRALVEGRAAIRAFPRLAIVAVLCHFTALATFAISVDGEFAAVRTHPEVWVAQGRWVAYLIERFVVPQPTIPYLPQLLLCLALAAAYLLILRAHRFAVDWKAYALFPLFCAFPIWGDIAQFYANLPSAALGLVLTAGAAALFASAAGASPAGPRPLQGRVSRLFAAAGMLAVATAAYQSLLFLFASIGLGVIATSALTPGQATRGATARRLGDWLFTLVAGVGLYGASQKLALAVVRVDTAYIGNFLHPGALLAQPGQVLGLACGQMLAAYTGAPGFYGTSLSALGWIGVLAVSGLLRRWASPPKCLPTVLVLLSGVASVPFALNLLAEGLMPPRTLLGVPYVLWLLASLAIAQGPALLRGVSAIVCLCATFQVLYLASLCGASAEVTQNHDRMLASSIYERITAVNPAFDRWASHPVDFFGAKATGVDVYPRVTNTPVNASIFEWDGGNPYRIVAFMRLLGYSDLVTVDEPRRQALARYFAPMPAWPAEGSVRLVEGVTLVKLGPGPTHYNLPEPP